MATTFLTNYQIQLRIVSIILMMYALYTAKKSPAIVMSIAMTELD